MLLQHFIHVSHQVADVGAAIQQADHLVAHRLALRVIGLIGLGLCVPRVFVVDIRSMLYRVVAFCALGLALLTVGFLYSRFGSRILGESAEKTQRTWP